MVGESRVADDEPKRKPRMTEAGSSEVDSSADLDEFRAEARTFLAQAKASGAACPNFGTIMPPAFHDQARSWQRDIHVHGFAGLHWPAEFGGKGAPVEQTGIWGEECARAGVAPYMNFQGVVLAGPAIVKFGTEQQKARYLEPTMSGEILWCQLFSEPNAGSDLVSLGATANAVDGGWRVTGQKVWSSTAHLAQQAILLARTDPDERGHRGISFFLLDMKTEGLDIRPLKQMTGDIEFCEVFMDDVFVPEENLLGDLNAGWTVATAVLADERAGAGAAGVALQHSVDQMAHDDTELPLTEVGRDRVMSLHATGGAVGHLLHRSSGDPTLGPLSKLARTELGSRMSGFALDRQGAAAMLENEATNEFLYAPGMRIAGGTSEIQRNLIGERLLGLPREPKPPMPGS